MPEIIVMSFSVWKIREGGPCRGMPSAGRMRPFLGNAF
jgi:hypothetical protein